MTASSADIVIRLVELAQTVGSAESLTGGLVVATLVDPPGASAVVRGGVVAYATPLKSSVLGVDAALLAERGAVDAEVARQLAVGARRVLGVDWAWRPPESPDRTRRTVCRSAASSWRWPGLTGRLPSNGTT